MKIIKFINFSLALFLFVTGLMYVPMALESFRPERLVITQVDQNDLSFLNNDDIILNINGDKTNNPDLVIALFKHGKLRKYDVSVLRNGEEVNGEVILADGFVFDNESLKLEIVKVFLFSIQFVLYSFLFFVHMIVAFYLIKNKIWANLSSFSILFLELLYYVAVSFTHSRPYFMPTAFILSVICLISVLPLLYFVSGRKANNL